MTCHDVLSFFINVYINTISSLIVLITHQHKHLITFGRLKFVLKQTDLKALSIIAITMLVGVSKYILFCINYEYRLTI